MPTLIVKLPDSSSKSPKYFVKAVSSCKISPTNLIRLCSTLSSFKINKLLNPALIPSSGRDPCAGLPWMVICWLLFSIR